MNTKTGNTVKSAFFRQDVTKKENLNVSFMLNIEAAVLEASQIAALMGILDEATTKARDVVE